MFVLLQLYKTKRSCYYNGTMYTTPLFRQTGVMDLNTFDNSPRRGASEYQNSLGQKYPKTEIGLNTNTKERILLEAAALFSKNGYHNVSVKDIAAVVGIKPASIYNHFENKEALWDAVLDRIYELYMLYFTRLDEALATANTFADVLNIMFYELREGSQPFISQGICLVQSEQFHNERAASMFNDVIIDFSADYIRKCFNECIEQGLAESFDTQMMAMLFMNSVVVLNNMRVHELDGKKTPYDATRAFEGLQRFIMESAGVESAAAG